MKIGVVTAIYIATNKHYQLTLNSMNSITSREHELYRIGVANHVEDDYVETVSSLYDHYFLNDENCLSSAWNKGIKDAIENGCEKILVSNLDVVYNEDTIDNLIKGSELYSNSVMWFPTISYEIYENERHPNDFSSFLVNKDFLDKVGGFHEGFKPAYFEDLEMRARIDHLGFTTKRIVDSHYVHLGQQTVKSDGTIHQIVGEAWKANEELYKQIISSY